MAVDNRVFWALGRLMMEKAPRLKSDEKSNDWARVGELLTTLGAPFSPKSFNSLAKVDQDVALAANAELEKWALKS